jgi:hypothetical protein
MDNPEKLATLGTQEKEKQNKKHHTICVGYHYMQSNINKVNKTRVLLQTTGGKEVTTIVTVCSIFCGKRHIVYIYDIINIKEVKIDDST